MDPGRCNVYVKMLHDFSTETTITYIMPKIRGLQNIGGPEGPQRYLGIAQGLRDPC